MTDSTSQRPTDGDHRIDVELPLRTEFAATIRVLMASLGADVGFSVDEIDDLRLGLSEAFSVLADKFPGERACVSIEVAPRQLTVTLGPRSAGPATEPIEVDALAAGILTSVVDSYSVDAQGFRLVKQASEAGAAR